MVELCLLVTEWRPTDGDFAGSIWKFIASYAILPVKYWKKVVNVPSFLSNWTWDPFSNGWSSPVPSTVRVKGSYSQCKRHSTAVSSPDSGRTTTFSFCWLRRRRSDVSSEFQRGRGKCLNSAYSCLLTGLKPVYSCLSFSVIVADTHAKQKQTCRHYICSLKIMLRANWVG